MMDEVYEYQRGNYKELPRMASIPGMWERSITIHSAGKMFCATGIRIGWAIASEHITNKLKTVYQYSSYCLAKPLQNAIAECIDRKRSL